MEARFEAKAAAYGIPSLIRSWKENVDNLCARQSGEGHDATPAAQQKPLRLSIS
jgi:hypothetical protein